MTSQLKYGTAENFTGSYPDEFQKYNTTYAFYITRFFETDDELDVDIVNEKMYFIYFKGTGDIEIENANIIGARAINFFDTPSFGKTLRFDVVLIVFLLFTFI